MKLVTKISAAAVGLLLLFSQMFSGWMLYAMREQRVESTVRYEWDNMCRREDEFRERWEKHQQNGGSLEEAYWGKKNVLECFDGDTALYYKGEEILNSTPYLFDLNSRANSSGYHSDATIGKESGHTFLEEVGGKRLLIQYVDVQDYQIIHYEDITFIYTEAEKLFYKGLAAAVILSLLLMIVLQQIIKGFYHRFTDSRMWQM